MNQSKTVSILNRGIRGLLPCLILASLVLVGCHARQHGGSSPGGPSLAITEVTVVDVHVGRILPDRTILISGSRITAVGRTRDLTVPTGAHVVNARGAYVIPGLIDAHVHLFNNVSRRSPNTWSFPLFVANGVTGVREMWTDFASMPTVERWRRGVSREDLLAPRVLAAGALVDGPRSWFANTPQALTPLDGRRFVHDAARAGADFVKVYSLLDPAVYRAVLEESLEAGVEVAGHVPLRIPLLESARLGQRTNEHLHQVREACSTVESQVLHERRRFYDRRYTAEEENALLDAQLHRATASYDEARCRRISRELAAADQFQVPTLVNERRWFFGAPPAFAEDERLAYVPVDQRDAWLQGIRQGTVSTYSGDPAALRAGWRATLQIVDVMSDAGVHLITGTEFGNPFILPGFSLHTELALLVDAGLSPLEALRSATVTPARAFGASDSLGGVAPGKLADLVLLDANPLTDIRNTQRIRAVVLGGSYLERERLDELLRRSSGTAGEQ